MKEVKRMNIPEFEQTDVKQPKIIELLQLIKLLNDNQANPLLIDEFFAFADYDEKIETIDDLIKVIKTEISYWD
jgi:hypothetical protein